MRDIIPVDMSASIATAVVWHLQRATKTFPSISEPVPAINCSIRLSGPMWELSDGQHSIETDFTEPARRQLRQCGGESEDQWRGLHITVLKYRLVRKAKHRYVLLVEELRTGSRSPSTEPSQPQGQALQTDPRVLHTMRMHQQYLDKVGLADQAESLPSFDAIAVGPSGKHPVLLCVGGGGNAIDELQFVKESTLEHQFVDFSKGELCRLLKAPFVGVDQQSSVGCRERSSLPVSSDTLPNPSLGTMEPEVHKSLHLLIAECKPPVPSSRPAVSVPTETQPDFSSPVPMQVEREATESRREDAHPPVFSQPQAMDESVGPQSSALAHMNIGIGVYQSEGVAKLRQERETTRLAFTSSDPSQDLLDVLKQKEVVRDPETSKAPAQASARIVATLTLTTPNASSKAGQGDDQGKDNDEDNDKDKNKDKEKCKCKEKEKEKGKYTEKEKEKEKGKYTEKEKEKDKGNYKDKEKEEQEKEGIDHARGRGREREEEFTKGGRTQRKQVQTGEFERYLKWRKGRLTDNCAAPIGRLNELFIDARELIEFTLQQRVSNGAQQSGAVKKKKTIE